MDLQRLHELLSSPEPGVRLQAVQAAGESGDNGLVGPLVQRLRIETDPKVRGALVTCLGRLGAVDGLAAIKAFARDPDAQVRCRLLEALYRAQDETVFPLAVRMLSDLDPQVKQLSFTILRKLGKEGILRIIGRMLNSEDVRWRVCAVAALGQVASDEGVALLARCLAHPTSEVRLQAKASLLNLAKHGNENAAAVIRRATARPAEPEAARIESSPDPNTTIVAEPLAILRKPASPLPPELQTVVVAPPVLAARPASGRTAAPAGAATVRPTVPIPVPDQQAQTPSSPAPPPAPGMASSVLKRSTNYVPLDEDSLKFTRPVPPPAQRRMSTAKYKALFGESMPHIQAPPPPPPVEETPEAPPAEEVPEEAAPEVEAEPGDGAPKKHGPKTWKDFQCKECQFALKARPDKQKMAPMRLWCNLVKKETSPVKNCPRGKWTDLH